MQADSLNYSHFESKDIKRLIGIDKNKLFYWIHTHRLIKPEVEEASGTGTRVKFSLKNLLEIAVIKEMLDYGFDMTSIKKIKKKLDNFEDKDKKIILNIFEDALEGYDYCQLRIVKTEDELGIWYLRGKKYLNVIEDYSDIEHVEEEFTDNFDEVKKKCKYIETVFDLEPLVEDLEKKLDKS